MCSVMSRWERLSEALRLNTVLLALASCSADNEQACADAQRVEEEIAQHAEQADGISASGLCLDSKSELVSRLAESPRWAGKPQTELEARADEYLSNCKKAARLRAECDD